MAETDRLEGLRRSRQEWLTVHDIAQLLHVSEHTVRRWIREGRLTANFFGGRIGYRVKDSDLQEFLRQHSVGSRQQRTDDSVTRSRKRELGGQRI